jgi:signal transduction histidine kinase
MPQTRDFRDREYIYFIILITVALLVLVANSIWYLSSERSKELKHTRQFSQVQAQLLAEHTAAILRQIELGLRSYSPAAVDPCNALRRAVLDLPGVETTLLVASDGATRCLLGSALPDSTLLDDLLRLHGEDMVGFNVGLTSRPEVCLFVSVRLDGHDGSFDGLIMAILSREFFTERYREYGTIDADLIALYEPDGRVLARWPDTGRESDSILVEPLFADAPEDALRSGGLYSWETAKSLATVYQLPGFPYRIVVAHSVSTVLDNWRYQLYVVGGVLFLVSLLGTIAAVSIRSNLIRQGMMERELHESIAREQEARLSRLEGLRVIAGGLSHDINNGMMVVLGNTELLALAALPAESRTAVTQIQDAARKAAALSERMQAVAAISMIYPAHIELAAFVCGLEAMFRSHINGASVELVVTDGGAALPVNADPTSIETALMNLVENASDALADRKGSITVRTGKVSIRGAVDGYISDDLIPGEYASILVADTGPGIDEAIAQKVFDPFFSTRFLGRGLGLPAVVGIMRQHNGAVALKTDPNTGTAVTLYLPLLSEELFE